MLIHPQFDPIAIQVGPLAIHWYGLMYLTAFGLFVGLGRRRLRRPLYAGTTGMSPPDVEDLLFYGVLGVILGGRLGYVLFYKPGHYLFHPLEIFEVWKGGMSFHGGLIGVLLACGWYAHRRQMKFLTLMDFVAPLVPLGLGAGRLGNFINGELWGRVTTVPWGMVFPQSGSPEPRHPSQLYQFAGEGLVLFAVVWWYSSKPRARGAISGVFLAVYGLQRFLAEFTREPDAFLGPVLGPFTMGQVLSVPMMVAGVWLVLVANAQAAEPSEAQESGVEPTGVEPTGVEPTGVEPTGVEPTGVEPTGVEPTGAATPALSSELATPATATGPVQADPPNRSAS